MKRRRTALLMAFTVTCSQMMSVPIPAMAEEIVEEIVEEGPVAESLAADDPTGTDIFSEGDLTGADDFPAVDPVGADERSAEDLLDENELSEQLPVSGEEMEAADRPALESFGEEADGLLIESWDVVENPELASEFDLNEEDFGEENGSPIGFAELYGGDHTWIYEGQDTELWLDTSALDSADGMNGYEIEWQVGTWEEEDRFIPAADGSWEALYGKEEEGSGPAKGIRLHGESWKAGDWFWVGATARLDEEEIGSCYTGVDVREPYLEYRYNYGSASKLPGWWDDIGSTIGCDMEDAEHPHGSYEEVPVLSVEAENAEDEEAEEPVVVVDTEEVDEEGNPVAWKVRAERYGHAVVTVTHKAYGSEESVQYSYDIWVGGDVFRVELDSDTGTDCLLPGQSMDISVKVWHDREEDYGRYEDAFAWEWGTWDWSGDGGEVTGEDAQSCITAEKRTGANGEYLHVTAKDLLEDRNTRIWVRAYACEEDGSIRVDENGNPCEIAFEGMDIYVQHGYYKLLPSRVSETPLEPGEPLTVVPQLLYYDSESDQGAAGTEVKENIRYRWEFDTNSVEITDAKGTVLGQEYEASFGDAPFTLKKLNCEGTDLCLIAELLDGGEDGAYQEVNRRYWYLDGLYYDCGFQYSYGDWEDAAVLLNHPLEVSLDDEMQVLLNRIRQSIGEDSIRIEWPVQEYDEETDQEYDADAVDWEINGDDKERAESITLIAREDHLFEYVNVRAKIFINETELAYVYGGVHVYEEEFSLSDGTEFSLVLGGAYWFESDRQARIWLRDENHTEGIQTEAKITSIAFSGDGEMICETEANDTLSLSAVGCGDVTVTITLSNEELWGDEEKTLDIVFHIAEELYFFSWELDADGQMFPNSTLQITPVLMHGYASENGGPVWETVADGTYRTEFFSEDEGIVSVDENGKITSYDRCEGTNIGMRAFWEGEEEPVTESFAWIQVTEYYYLIELPDQYQLCEGESAMISPVVKRYSQECPDGTEVAADDVTWDVRLWNNVSALTEKDLTLTVQKNVDFSEDSVIATGFDIFAEITMEDGGRWDAWAHSIVEIRPCAHGAMKKNVRKEATCTEPGSIEYWSCDTCGRNFTDASGTAELSGSPVIAAQGHKLTHTAAKAATCTTAGTREYWYCGTCRKYFGNAAGTAELPGSPVIAAQGHKLTHTAAKAATCTTAGTREYWYCGTCRKYFGNAAGTAELPGSPVIAAQGHKLTHTAAKAATCTAAGTREYWYCGTCRKYFGNAAGTAELTGSLATGLTGHSWGEWKTVSTATVWSAAKEQRSCPVCRKTEARESGKALTPTLTLNTTSIPLKVKQSTTKVLVSSLAAGDSVASWTSGNTKLVKVSGKASGTCKITAQNKTGSTFITVTLASGRSEKIKVKVQKSAVKTTKVIPSQKKLTLERGKKASLSAVVQPVTSLQKVTFSSSNKKVATVNSKGVVTAKGSGKAKITIKSGSKKATVTVTVPKCKTVSIGNVPSALTLKKGKKLTLKPKRNPSKSEEKITYKTSNKKVAVVDKKGKITAKKAGTAVITVISGAVKKTCVVTVK